MKFNWLYLLIFFLACSSQAGEAPGNTESTSATVHSDIPLESPEIDITVEGMQAGTTLLVGMFQEQQYVADSAVVDARGRMTFEREAPYRPGLFLVYLPDKQNFQLLIERDQTFSVQTRGSDLVGSMQVEGCIDNELLYEDFHMQREENPAISAASQRLSGVDKNSDEYAALKAARDELVEKRRSRLQEIFDKYPNSFFTKYKRAGQNPEVVDVRRPDGTIDNVAQVYLYRTQFWDGVDFSSEALMYTPVISNKLKRYIEELTYQNADSIIASTDHLIQRVLDYPGYYQYFVNWIALQYEPGKTTLMDAEAVYVHIIQNYITYDRVTWTDSANVHALQLRAHEMAGSLVGNKAPAVTAPDINGRSQALYDMTNPYVAVYLYNPTCDHCQEQTPKLVNYKRQMGNKFGVYAIAINTEDPAWKKFVRDYRMDAFINVHDPSNRAIYAKYYVDNTPEIYLLNPDRTIIAKNLKVFQIAEMIQRDEAAGD